MTLAGVVVETFASRKQLAEPKRSSVKAKAYPSQAGISQQAMRQAPSEMAVRGASVMGVPTRSMRESERKREGRQERPEVRVDVGVAAWLEEGVDVWLEEGVAV